MLELNKIHHGDCTDVMQDIDSNSVDCILTDPPYGISFMGKDRDKAVPAIEIWQECLRVLKPGAFTFVMCIPRQDCLARMICRLEDAAFNVSFSSIYHTFASGFPKAQNLSKAVDKRNGRGMEQYKALGEYLKEKRGDKVQKEFSKHFPSKTGGLTGCVANWELGLNVPTKEQWLILKRELNLDTRFDELIEREEAEREVIGERRQRGNSKDSIVNLNASIGDVKKITIPKTLEVKALDGAYGGFQPKPAVEIIIVAMKPLSEKTYIDQAISNEHGCMWLDDCRIPFNKDTEPRKSWEEFSTYKSHDFHSTGTQVLPGLKRTSPFVGDVQKGRFPANVLCEDNVMDDGHTTKSVGGEGVRSECTVFKGTEGHNHFNYGDIGAYSRYFSLDAWFAERIKQLPKEAQKTFPWLIVPKASKSEKNRGCEDFEGNVRFSSINKTGCMLPARGSELHQTRKGNFHPTCKPIKLMSWLITLASREGGIVLDPFCGSGTTAIAAKMLGRQYICIEREEEYCEIACKRVAAIPTNLSRY